jgi:2-keto-4-pentenoate hydratase/2-oxohepta-3-ene-1,7-dioic acid hydratase in catechol pathway
MRIANLIVGGVETPSVLDPARGWVPLAGLGTGLAGDVPGLIATGLGDDVRDRLLTAAAAASDAGIVPADAAVFTAPFRKPRMLWGIGLNYLDHARDLDAPHPTEPASFVKGDHTIIGPGDEILLPPQSERVTAEAELGIVIGRRRGRWKRPTRSTTSLPCSASSIRPPRTSCSATRAS